MFLRTSLKNLIHRDPAASLRERAADLQARIPAPKPSADAPGPTRAEQVAHAGLTGDVLAASGIDHRDGTVSYADATGKVSRRPMARWIAFNALQMHSHVQAEIGRRRVNETGDMAADEYAAWEARVRRDLRADAVAALTLNPERAFQAEQDRRSGAEPTTAEGRAETDAMLLSLAPEWEAARDAYAEAIQRQIVITDAATADDHPGPAPEGSGPDWQAWFQRSKEWRERTGVEAAEEASAEACRALGEIEDRIAELPAASLAGLRLKARVAQRNDDVAWPDELGTGLVRDLLAFTNPANAVDWHNPPPGFMAAPAIKPFSFTQVHNGIAMELDRLRGIAWAEFHRRAASLREGASQDEVREHRAKIHADLFLPALTAAVDRGSTEAQVLAALGRPTGPDPVLALIEAHRDAYAKWRPLADVQGDTAVGTPEHAASAAEEGPSRAEIDAYNALFSARPTTLHGTLALAEYLQSAVREAQIEPKPDDGERALSVVVDALRTVMATREERSRRETSLVGMLNLASATMTELRDIQDIAEHVGAVAYAYTYGPRCGTRGGRYGAIEPNDIGKLMHWLGDALTEIESAVDKEVACRVPGNSADRETRLMLRARPIIEDGDSDQTAAFARELLAHAEAERAGR